VFIKQKSWPCSVKLNNKKKKEKFMQMGNFIFIFLKFVKFLRFYGISSLSLNSGIALILYLYDSIFHQLLVSHVPPFT
jgi:hypothetical protein